MFLSWGNFGYEIDHRNETSQQSLLQRLYLAQGESFNDSYATFQQTCLRLRSTVTRQRFSLSGWEVNRCSAYSLILRALSKTAIKRLMISVERLDDDDLAELRSGLIEFGASQETSFLHRVLSQKRYCSVTASHATLPFGEKY